MLTIEELKRTADELASSANGNDYSDGCENDRAETLKAALDELEQLRAEVQRKTRALEEIHQRCLACRCGYSPCGCGAFAEDAAYAALNPDAEVKT